MGEQMGGLSHLEYIRALAKRVEGEWESVQVGGCGGAGGCGGGSSQPCPQLPSWACSQLAQPWPATSGSSGDAQLDCPPARPHPTPTAPPCRRTWSASAACCCSATARWST
jgi:hypothetical protein